MFNAETKTKAASLVAFILSGLALTFLGTTATDYVHALPDWLEVPVYSVLDAVIIYVAAFRTKHKPDALSESALSAARSRLGR